MNLYNVMDKNYDWGCFVFAPNRNKAKAIISRYFDQDYIDLRSNLLKRGILNPSYCLVVDCPEDENYYLVEQLGFSYKNEEW